MFPEPTELLLIVCLIESIWIPTFKLSTLTPKTNSQKYWTREISHVMNGIIFFVCLTSAVSIPLIVLNRCRKEHKQMQVKKGSQQNQSRWWIWYHDAMDPNVLASTAPESLGKTIFSSQNVPLSSLNVQQTGTERLVLGASSSNYSEWNIDEKRSSQEQKSGEMSKTSTVRLVSSNLVIDDDMWTLTPPQNRTFLWNHVHSWTEWMIECERCWTVLQKIQCKTLINVLWFVECLSSTLEASVFMRKNYSDNLHSVRDTGKDPTLKQMFDISEKLTVGQSQEIFGVSPINWEDSSWKQSSLVNDEEVISLSHAKVYVFSDSVLCLGRGESEPNIKYCLGTTVGVGSKIHHNWWWTDGIRVEYFPVFTTLQLVQEVQKFMNKMSEPEQFQGRSIFMWTFNEWHQMGS